MGVKKTKKKAEAEKEKAEQLKKEEKVIKIKAKAAAKKAAADVAQAKKAEVDKVLQKDKAIADKNRNKLKAQLKAALKEQAELKRKLSLLKAPCSHKCMFLRCHINVRQCVRLCKLDNVLHLT